MFHTIRDDMIAYKDCTLYISISQISRHIELLSAEAHDEFSDSARSQGHLVLQMDFICINTLEEIELDCHAFLYDTDGSVADW